MGDFKGHFLVELYNKNNVNIKSESEAEKIPIFWEAYLAKNKMMKLLSNLLNENKALKSKIKYLQGGQEVEVNKDHQGTSHIALPTAPFSSSSPFLPTPAASSIASQEDLIALSLQVIELQMEITRRDQQLASLADQLKQMQGAQPAINSRSFCCHLISCSQKDNYIYNTIRIHSDSSSNFWA